MTAPIAAQRAPPGLPSLRGPLLGTWSHTLCGIPPLGKFLASVVWTYCPLPGDSSHISSISPAASRVKLEPSIDKVQGDYVGSPHPFPSVCLFIGRGSHVLGVGAALGFLAQSSSFLKAQLAGRCGSPTNQRGRAMGTEVGAARAGVCSMPQVAMFFPPDSHTMRPREPTSSV